MMRATDVAGVCSEIVKRTARFIQGRKYVQVEGWQSIAAAYGCVASSIKVERIEGGIRAIGELHRISDGSLLATAEGFVGEDEATWFGGELTDKWGKTKKLPKRDDFAIRAMAQTRAISRVCRSAFAFVVVLIDANFSTTPAEEMSGAFPEEDEKPIKRKEKVVDAEDEALKSLEQGAQMPQSASTGAGRAPDSNSAQPSTFETRDQTLTRLCAIAVVNKIDLLVKAHVQHADELSDVDWNSCVAMLNRKIAKLAEKLQP
jgi:hypothetical protein